MKTKSIARIAAVAFLALALALLKFGVRQARAAREELDALSRKQSVLDPGIKQQEDRITADRRESGQLRAALAGHAPAGKAQAAAGANAQLALITSNPQLLDLYLKVFRATQSFRYRPFYRLAGLSPEQIEKFESLVAKHEEDRMDLIATAEARGPDDAQALADFRKQQNDQFQADETALLGQDGYQQLRQYGRAEQARVLVYGAEASSAEDQPYTEAQAAQLMQILTDSSAPYQQGGQFTTASVDWNTALARAAAILSPEQLGSLRVQSQWGGLIKLMQNYAKQKPAK